MQGLKMILLCIGFLPLSPFADDSKATFFTSEAIADTSECAALLERDVHECKTDIRSGSKFWINGSDVDRLRAFRNQQKESRPDPTAPAVTIRKPPYAVKVDSTITISIHGNDTTRSVSYSKPQPDMRNIDESLQSMAGSLRFMAIVTGISFAISAIAVIAAWKD